MGVVIQLPYDKALLFALKRCQALDAIYLLRNKEK